MVPMLAAYPRFQRRLLERISAAHMLDASTEVIDIRLFFSTIGAPILVGNLEFVFDTGWVPILYQTQYFEEEARSWQVIAIESMALHTHDPRVPRPGFLTACAGNVWREVPIVENRRPVAPSASVADSAPGRVIQLRPTSAF